MDARYEKQTYISVVRWLDSCVVQLSVTHVGVEPLSTLKRGDLKQKKYIQVICPAIVREYNHHMGGVNLFDMLLTLYKVDHKSRKWYRRIFYWSFNVAIVNDRLLYKRQCQQMGTPVYEQSDLLKFTITVNPYNVQLRAKRNVE